MIPIRSLLGVKKPLGIKRPSSSQSLTHVRSVLKPGGSSLKVSLIHASRYGISLMLSWSILPSQASTTSSTSSTSLACTSGFFARQKDKEERVLAVVSKPARMKTIALYNNDDDDYLIDGHAGDDGDDDDHLVIALLNLDFHFCCFPWQSQQSATGRSANDHLADYLVGRQRRKIPLSVPSPQLYQPEVKKLKQVVKSQTSQKSVPRLSEK